MSTKNDINKILLKKFPHLEISVVKYSEVQTDNESIRIDSEYFKQIYLQVVHLIKKGNYIQLKDTDITIKHPAEIERNYIENGIWFVRAQNVKSLSLDINNKVFISQEDADKLSKNIIRKTDILMIRTGSCGDCVVYLEKENAIASSHIFIIRNTFFSQYFLSIFFSCKYGKLQIERGKYGSLQPEIATSYLKNIYIPMFSKEFQLEIEAMVKDSHKALENSKKLYKEAEAILYEALGLDAENPLESILSFDEEDKIVHSLRLDGGNSKGYIVASPNYSQKYKGLNISIRTYKESYLKTGRLDAEYYQVKYDLIENVIKSYSEGWNIVSSYFEQNKTYSNFDKSQYNYIEISDINISDGTASYNSIEVNNLPANAKILINKNDILVSKVRPYRGAVAIIDFEAEDIIASGAFVILREKTGFKKEVLKVLLRSVIYKELLLKYNVGISYPVIKDEDILNLPIPLLDLKTQIKIEAKIQQSFELRDKSKELLENAKLKIEKAIIEN